MRAERRLRIWLHEGHDGEPGVEAWAPDWLGFATWAESHAELRAKLSAKLGEYRLWRERHDVALARVDLEPEIVATEAGGELLFAPDREPATRAEVALAIRLLEASRADLLGVLDSSPPELLDWDPPYRRFAPWATWRTIRATLAHIADAETHYYLRNLGCEPEGAQVDTSGDWRAELERARAGANRALASIEASADRARVRTLELPFGREDWSVRKSLRRLVAHELQHTKSIARIARAFAASARNSGP